MILEHNAVILPEHIQQIEYRCGEDLTDIGLQYNVSTICGFMWGCPALAKYAPIYQQRLDEDKQCTSLSDVYEEFSREEYWEFWALLCNGIPRYKERFVALFNENMVNE